MPSDRTISANHQRTLKRLAASGTSDISARQLRRWTLEGLLPSPEQQNIPGYAGGSVSRWDDSVLGQILAVRQLIVEDRKSCDEARIVLFRQGRYVDLDKLRNSFRLGSYAHDLERLAHAQGADGDEPEDVADGVA